MDYSKTIIYKIDHIENESLVYVGHTTNWEQRKYKHKSNYYNHKGKCFNFKLYQMIRENGGWEKFKMIEVEKYPCNDRREAERRENEVMKDMKAIMNTRSSFLTEDDKKKRDKKYYESNKQNIKEQQKNTENKTKNT